MSDARAHRKGYSYNAGSQRMVAGAVATNDSIRLNLLRWK